MVGDDNEGKCVSFVFSPKLFFLEIQDLNQDKHEHFHQKIYIFVLVHVCEGCVCGITSGYVGACGHRHFVNFIIWKPLLSHSL